MTDSKVRLRVGTRQSTLAVVQTRSALDRIGDDIPVIGFDLVQVSSPGDRDREADLQTSPADFFTRDLDDAVRGGDVDLAIHSAKDLPDPMPPDLEWFWLPWYADRRDVLVLRPGMTVDALPDTPRIGVSSARREAYARRRFPAGHLRSIRGNIEQRLAQLDDGDFDGLIMAGTALERLALLDRVTEWIPLDVLTPPEGQGYLAVTYRRGNATLNRLRAAFVKTARFVGAGVGDLAHLTLRGRQAVEHADVCLHDVLMDTDVLAFLSPRARCIDVGKRCGAHRVPQDVITQTILDEVRKGRRVVRLKGGDPGLFGRLAEELDAMDAAALPYRVLPGVSSLTAGTTGTGLLLTRRGVSRGFCALTPRGAGGKLGAFSPAERAQFPLVFFMALRLADDVTGALLAEGRAPDEPAAVVLDAGGTGERVIRTTLAGLAGAAATAPKEAAGLLVVGDICGGGRPGYAGALEGERVLVTCSGALQERAAVAVTDAGGIPVRFPVLRLSLRPEAVDLLSAIDTYTWVVLTSPSSARCFLDALRATAVDMRRVPRLMVCGPGTERVLRGACLCPDLVPDRSFGADGLLRAARRAIRAGDRVLRLRSDRAGRSLSDGLAELGAAVTDAVLYTNERVLHDRCPPCDAVFVASASAVESLVAQDFTTPLRDARVLSIGGPTQRALTDAGWRADVVGRSSTVEGAIAALAYDRVARAIAG